MADIRNIGNSSLKLAQSQMSAAEQEEKRIKIYNDLAAKRIKEEKERAKRFAEEHSFKGIARKTLDDIYNTAMFIGRNPFSSAVWRDSEAGRSVVTFLKQELDNVSGVNKTLNDEPWSKRYISTPKPSVREVLDVALDEMLNKKSTAVEPYKSPKVSKPTKKFGDIK